MKYLLGRSAFAAALSMIMASAAHAQPPAAEPVTEVATTEAPAAPFSRARVADDEALNRATAREDVSIVAQSQQASSVSGSSVSGVTTGSLALSDNAFQNASGLTVINANTGNNVAMNGSITVNIVMGGPQP